MGPSSEDPYLVSKERVTWGNQSFTDFKKWRPHLSTNENLKRGFDEMGLLVSYLEAFDVVDKVSFDLSLARGLDYYSGLIFEVINKQPSRNDIMTQDKKGISPSAQQSKKESDINQVGSIAGDGRYDNLVGMYGKNPIPCFGISFGVDRVFTILNARRAKQLSLVVHEIDVYVMALGGADFDGLLLERMAIARRLWNAGIRAEFAAKVKPKLPQQFRAAKGVPLAVILGQDEVAAGQVRLKVFGLGDDESDVRDRGYLVSIEELVEEVHRLLKKK